MISGQVNISKIVNVWWVELTITINWSSLSDFFLKLLIGFKFLISNRTMSYTYEAKPLEELKPY